jgi:hypothetical protein
MSTKVAVAIGDQVYVEHGEEEFGSVRSVSPQDLVVDVENFGDVVIPATAVLAIHPGKVIVDATKLPADVRRAVERAHAAEDS